jgi:hypothetical protein
MSISDEEKNIIGRTIAEDCTNNLLSHINKYENSLSEEDIKLFNSRISLIVRRMIRNHVKK